VLLGLFAVGNAVYAVTKKMAAEDARHEALDAREKANKSLNLTGTLVSVQLRELRETKGIGVSSLKRILDGSREPFDEVAGALSRNAIYRKSYANMMTEYGRVYLRVGDLATALDFFEKSLSIRDLSNKQDDRVASLRGIADQLEEISRIMQQRGNLAKAAEDSDRAFKLRSEIINLSDADALSFRDLGRSLYQRGDLIKLMTKDAATAADIQETARTMMETSRSLGGPGPEIDLSISLIYGSLAEHYEALRNSAKRQASLSESLRLLKGLHDRDPDNIEYTRYLAWAHQALGGFYLETGNWENALDNIRHAWPCARRWQAATGSHRSINMILPGLTTCSEISTLVQAEPIWTRPPAITGPPMKSGRS
jgi:tetratricopeptide (TPR) repeat protein